MKKIIVVLFLLTSVSINASAFKGHKGSVERARAMSALFLAEDAWHEKQLRARREKILAREEAAKAKRELAQQKADDAVAEKKALSSKFAELANGKRFSEFNNLCLKHYRFVQASLKRMEQRCIDDMLMHSCSSSKGWKECDLCQYEPTMKLLRKGLEYAERNILRHP